MGVQEKRRNRFEERKIPEEIMTENFLHFGKTNLQIDPGNFMPEVSIIAGA